MKMHFGRVFLLFLGMRKELQAPTREGCVLRRCFGFADVLQRYLHSKRVITAPKAAEPSVAGLGQPRWAAEATGRRRLAPGRAAPRRS